MPSENSWLTVAVALVVLLAALGFVAVSFNRLVRRRNLALEAWSGVDVQLKRRHDLVPELVAIVQGYARFERHLLEEVTRLQSEVMTVEGQTGREAAENALSARVKHLMALAENYPELQASRSFLSFQKRLEAVEEQIQLARRYHNGTVRDYNVLVAAFPTNLVAGLFGFREAGYSRIDSVSERHVPRLEIDS